MIKKKLFLIFLLCLSCSSDEVVRSEKSGFYGVYKDILAKATDSDKSEVKKKREIYNKKWLSKFKQPIVLLSSLDGKKSAALVALGNYDNQLTWVSADGISVSFKNGILIATRGYSEDIIETDHGRIDSLFGSPTGSHTKTHRYLDGINEYKELRFSCSIESKPITRSLFFDLNIPVTKFSEFCVSKNIRHTNEYYVLSGTDIVLKSKQWISESNGSIIIDNYYVFQNNLIEK